MTTQDTAEQKPPHTAGPWKLWLTNDDPGAFSVTTTDLVICQRNVGTPNGDEGVANARLIAAAPDLLALVYQYRDDMRHGVSELGSRGRRLEQIEAVLARVEGR